MCRLSTNSGSLKFLEPSGPVQSCLGLFYFFVYCQFIRISNNTAVNRMSGDNVTGKRKYNLFIFYLTTVNVPGVRGGSVYCEVSVQGTDK
jgi:hypothetical protein